MDLTFSNHPSTSSEHVKFLYHNASYELVESLQGKVKIFETEFEDYKTKANAVSKTVNSATQKVDDAKKSLADLTKTVNKTV